MLGASKRNFELYGAYEREFSRYISPGPGEQEGSRESLKGHIALAIDVLHFLTKKISQFLFLGVEDFLVL
jgi:hypothetical protein